MCEMLLKSHLLKQRRIERGASTSHSPLSVLWNLTLKGEGILCLGQTLIIWPLFTKKLSLSIKRLGLLAKWQVSNLSQISKNPNWPHWIPGKFYVNEACQRVTNFEYNSSFKISLQEKSAHEFIYTHGTTLP